MTQIATEDVMILSFDLLRHVTEIMPRFFYQSFVRTGAGASFIDFDYPLDWILTSENMGKEVVEKKLCSSGAL